ncbi:MAG: hypothetical protein PWP27_1635 [Clostridiales bacterium]|nr:hypothetical protein [Clostridiales bacterium]
MKNINDEMENLKRLIKMLANQFGSKCEIVLHDLTKDYEHTIVAIENGHITGRKVGDCGSNLGLEVLRGTNKSGDRYNYITQSNNGKILRSSTMYIRDNENKVIGAICINFDITNLLMAENVLKEITMYSFENEEVKEVFVNNVNELLDYFLQECQKLIGKPVLHMTKEDKIKAVEYLDKKGVFLITKSGDKICEYLNISKFTLYNYLDIVRKRNENKFI